MALLAATAIVATGAGPAEAGPAACATADAAGQSACLLAAAIPDASGTPGSSTIGAPVLAPLSARDFKPAAAAEIVAAPESFLRKPISVAAARCFSFGVGDYRCVVADPPVAVAAAILIPPASQVAVERGCPGSGSGPACGGRISLVPSEVSRMAVPGGPSLTVLRAPSILFAAEAATDAARAATP